jgi:hypothetical protein
VLSNLNVTFSLSFAGVRPNASKRCSPIRGPSEARSWNRTQLSEKVGRSASDGGLLAHWAQSCAGMYVYDCVLTFAGSSSA